MLKDELLLKNLMKVATTVVNAVTNDKPLSQALDPFFNRPLILHSQTKTLINVESN